MGGKSRKTGNVSKALIDRIKAGGSLQATAKKAPTSKKAPKANAFGLGLINPGAGN